MSTRHASDNSSPAMFMPETATATTWPREKGSNMTFETRNHTTRGLKLRLHVHGPADAPCMLLLHGLFDNGASYAPLANALQRLSGNGWRCIAPDWRGHGDSDRAPEG